MSLRTEAKWGAPVADHELSVSAHCCSIRLYSIAFCLSTICNKVFKNEYEKYRHTSAAFEFVIYFPPQANGPKSQYAEMSNINGLSTSLQC